MIKHRFSRACAVLAGIIGITLPHNALASTVSSVGGPNVTQGQAKVDFRLGYNTDDNDTTQDDRLRLRAHYDYGLEDWYAMRLVIAGDKQQGDNLETGSIGLENRFELVSAAQYGLDFGARLNYSHSLKDNTADKASFRLYQQIPLGQWRLRFNEIFDHEIGEDSTGGVMVEMRSQLTYRLENDYRIGFESFNDFGRINDLSGYNTQDHTAGPVIEGPLYNTIGFKFGYRNGVSNAAADHGVALFLSTAF